MTPVGRYLLLDGSVDIERLASCVRPHWQGVLCLCWIAPETANHLADLTQAPVSSLKDIPGGIERVQLETCALVDQVCQGGPKYRGLAWTEYIREPLYRELEQASVVAWALDFLLSLTSRDERLEVQYVLSPGNLSVLRHLLEYRQETHVDLVPLSSECFSSVAPGERPPLPSRMGRHLRQVMLTGKWRIQAWNAAEKLDPAVLIRRRIWPGTRKTPRGGVTFFSSYLNNTRILLSHEACFVGKPIDWVVTTHYAMEAAREAGRKPRWLWEWRGPEPVAFDVSAQPVSSEKDHGLLSWASQTSTFDNWQNNWHRSLATLTSCWEGYLDEAAPSMLVVASQWGIEGWLARLASLRGIHTVQLLHGVVAGPFFSRSAVETDELWVPGPFWKTLWTASQRSKIKVVRPEGYFRAVPRNSGTHRLTYFSWPLQATPILNASELNDAFAKILTRLAKAGNKVFVHAHPLENPTDLMRRWKKVTRQIPDTISFGKHRQTAALLAETDVALMFRSTVMLDCMASGIPVVIPGWIDMGMGEHLANTPGVHCAENFEDLERTLVRWLEQPPEIPDIVRQRFVV